MKYKLVLYFDRENEIVGIPKSIIFNNHLDAISYFNEQQIIQDVVIFDEYFTFSFGNIKGTGDAFWALDESKN